MAENSQKLLAKADKTYVSATSSWAVFSNKQDKFEQAAEQYDAAANALKLEKSFERSGEIYQKCAAIYEQLEMLSDAAQAYDKAFLSYNQVSPEHAAKALEASIEGFKKAKNLRRAAGKVEDLAKMYEVMGNTRAAKDRYEEAALLYRGENAEITANRARVKAAELTALLAVDDNRDYLEASKQFLEVARSNVNNNSLKFAVKDHLFHAGLCYLAFMDEPTIANGFREFPEIDRQFMGTREYKLLEDMLEAFKQQDPDMFVQNVNGYANLSPLKLWEETMIGRIEDTMRTAEEDFS